jgi:AmmeMemoRadiSam system protein B
MFFMWMFMVVLTGTLTSSAPIIHKEPERAAYDIDARIFIDKKQINISVPQYMETIQGGIVPHHHIAYSMIGEFYETLEKEADLIMLIGPNHSGKGPRYQAVGSTYMTHYGQVTPSPLFGQLLNDDDVVIADDTMLRGEHSVGIHMNFISAYYENTPVLTLLVHETGGIHGVDLLAQKIKHLIGDKNVVIIGSVDFSHDLSLEHANMKDQLTKEILKNKSYKRLFSLNNDYLDSPTTAYLTIMLLKEMGYEHQVLLKEGNAALILNRPRMKATTSYLVYGYGKQD